MAARRTQAQRREETRRALLDAAAELFAERGYNDVSLDQLAARAGLTRGALHYNFAGKHELLLALLDERMQTRGAQIDDATPENPAAALPFDRQISLLFLEFAAAAARDPEIGAALIERLTARRLDNVPALRRLLARANTDDPPVEDLVHIFGAFVNGLSIEALAGAPLDELERLFDLLVEVVVKRYGGS